MYSHARYSISRAVITLAAAAFAISFPGLAPAALHAHGAAHKVAAVSAGENWWGQP